MHSVLHGKNLAVKVEIDWNLFYALCFRVSNFQCLVRGKCKDGFLKV